MVNSTEQSEFEHIKQRLLSIRGEISAVRELRDNFNLDVKKFLEAKREKQSQILKMRESVKKYKNERNRLNAKVKEIKKQLKNLEKIIDGKNKKYYELRTKIGEFKKLVPTSGDVAKEKFESLEWTIQTTPLNPKQERAIIDQVKLLEEQLLVHKKMEKEKSKIAGEKDGITIIRNKINFLYNEISKPAEESHKEHKKMVNIFSQIDSVIEEIKETHQKFLEARSNADTSHKKFMELIKEQRSLETLLVEIVKKEENVKNKKATESQEEIVKNAEEKFKMGNKLSLEEFRLLVGKNKIKLEE